MKTKSGLIKNYEFEEISVETKNFILHKINGLRNQIALGDFKDIHSSSNMRLVVSILYIRTMENTFYLLILVVLCFIDVER